MNFSMKEIRRILITGASGFVGGRVCHELCKKYELITPSHSELDVTSAEDVAGFVAQAKPDIILHLAAISNTGYCEEHPDESYLVNVVSVENLARAAASHGAGRPGKAAFWQARPCGVRSALPTLEPNPGRCG